MGAGQDGFEISAMGVKRVTTIPGAVAVPDGRGHPASTGPAALLPGRPQTPAPVHTLRTGPVGHAHPFVAPLQHKNTHTYHQINSKMQKKRENIYKHKTGLQPQRYFFFFFFFSFWGGDNCHFFDKSDIFIVKTCPQNNQDESLCFPFFEILVRTKQKNQTQILCCGKDVRRGLIWCIYPFLDGVGLTNSSLCSRNAAGDAAVTLAHAPKLTADLLLVKEQ